MSIFLWLCSYLIVISLRYISILDYRVLRKNRFYQYSSNAFSCSPCPAVLYLELHAPSPGQAADEAIPVSLGSRSEQPVLRGQEKGVCGARHRRGRHWADQGQVKVTDMRIISYTIIPLKTTHLVIISSLIKIFYLLACLSIYFYIIFRRHKWELMPCHTINVNLLLAKPWNLFLSQALYSLKLES